MLDNQAGELEAKQTQIYNKIVENQKLSNDLVEFKEESVSSQSLTLLLKHDELQLSLLMKSLQEKV